MTDRDPADVSRKASTETPPSIDQRVEAALTRQKRGDFAFAQSVYRQALAENPRHARALHYSGLLAQQRGRTSEAIDLVRRSIKQDPDDPRAYNHLGLIYYRAGDIEQAERVFKSGLGRAPAHSDTLNSYANLLSSKGAYDKAVALYRQALAAAPEAAHVAFNLANTLKKSGAAHDAVEAYKTTLALQPAHAGARHSLAVALEESGDFDGAVAHYETALRTNPDHARALANLLCLKPYRANPALVERAQELAASASPRPAERAKLHHGLGKHFDRAGHVDAAFTHFAESNALQSTLGEGFDPAAHRNFVSGIIETFSTQFFQKQRGHGVASEKPVFIVGMPRSGTTLAEHILASHRRVYGAGELLHIPQLCNERLRHFPDGLATCGKPETTQMAHDYLKRAGAGAPADALRVTDKLPTNFLYLGLIALLFPRAKIIYCKRHPMDVGFSCFVEMFRKDRDFSLTLEDIASYLIDHLRLMDHWRTALPSPILELNYEDMVENPEAQTRRLLDFCGLDWDASCLAFHETARRVNTPSRWQVRQPIYRSSVSRWKRYERQLAPLSRALKGYNHH